jgi:hypothetical protein
VTGVEGAGLEALKRVLGEGRADRLAGYYRDRVLPTAETVAYGLSSQGRQSRRRLLEFRDAYAGKRCFIIGNGPSLVDTDLTFLRDEYTFALNRGYLLFDRIGGPTTFLVAVNQHVVQQFGTELLKADTTTFVSWRSRHFVPQGADVTLVRRAPRFTFSTNVATHGAWEGATVTYVAMQLAFHLGFNEVVLVGVDHSFATAGPANKLVTSTGSDPNHFDPNYFGPGVRWQLPDLAMSEVAYRLAKEHFAANGRTILDATVGGKLTVFPKVDYAVVVSSIS